MFIIASFTILPSDTTNHHETRNIFTPDSSFTLSFNCQNEIKQENDHMLLELSQPESNPVIVTSPKTVSNTSSPLKHRVLNTPERVDRVIISFQYFSYNNLFIYI